MLLSPPDVSRNALDSWCRDVLGSQPRDVLFASGHLSSVFGLELSDGRAVVVKVRAQDRRIQECISVQRHLWLRSFPCPEPLSDAVPLGPYLASAERYVPGGNQYGDMGTAPEAFAELLARQVSVAPDAAGLSRALTPPPWAWWDHDREGTWPLPDDRAEDLNQYPAPDWLGAIASGARQRIDAGRGAMVAVHCDWESQNVRWLGDVPHVVHDWDSTGIRSEAAAAGVAAATFMANGADRSFSNLVETEAFLRHYESARRLRWTVADWQVAWAAGLWMRAFNVKKQSLEDAGAPDRFREECRARAILAELDPGQMLIP